MANALRVLIIEDSEDDAFLLLRELKKGGYEVEYERVETSEAMMEAIVGSSWDIAISDYVLPRFSGLEALEIWRRSGFDAPFIVVSGKIGEDTAVGAMRAGANDYFIKGNISRLVPAIQRELKEAELRRKKREAEDALLTSELRYRRLVAAVTDYIYTVAVRDGKVVRTSHGPGCTAVTGYDPEELEDDPYLWYEMIHEEDRQRVAGESRRLLEGEYIPSMEHRIIHKDGSIRWVRNTIVPRYDETGELAAYDGLIADITERKSAEIELKLRSAALNAAANAIIISDPEGKVIWANPAFTLMTGYTPDEIIGRSLGILNSGVHGKEFYRDLWETIRAGKVWRGEMINRRKDGSLYPEEQTITPVMDENGTVRHYIAIKEDVTERKRAQEALLENARMSCDMELARQIQRSLLPAALPAARGVRCAGRWVPAAHVGGDYYDFFPRDDGSFDTVIADVSGHSVGAALIMTEARSVIRAQARSGGSPAVIVGSLNEILYEDLTRAELFTTLFYASYQPASRVLTYASAGHNPPLLCRASGEQCLELDAEGLILGVRLQETFEEREVRLEPGDILFLYTDGITESDNGSGELFGVERLGSLLRARCGEEPEAVIEAVLADLAAFTGGRPPADDICMVAVKIMPSSGSGSEGNCG
ncbi:SpoIIE family protein phosphatase [Geobacter benzoatilyticus]|uniref:SpoIIE family protein phosphatase n=1 Tax=Geobacter benzoatilyticus TaxID=2815309 RepID=A0ABX7Q4U3_9BACT|nr:SpoIIE family protein phosphatase [Geobacter benzoatilyticus]QSV46073.1 SpoIIE family protein phosphatase [Geobacter benzoatilyticus]